MADNVYLLETRLSAAQRAALEAVRMVAREQGMTVFLVGGAVRDLISGSPVRDLDVVLQGDASKLRKEMEKVGATYSGATTALKSLHVRFPSGVRVEVGSTLSVTFPKPGKPQFALATIQEDLRRRDFTANAMALSLNEGSYGLLMDPLNGVADIENRELRLVSNYGFIEDPIRLIRAARFMARLGWHMDERTQTRYQTAKDENYIAAMQEADRAYEAEELFHEEEPLRVMRKLEEEGWLAHLSPALGTAKVNVAELTRLRESQMLLETHGIRADAASANFPLLTAKVPPAEIASLKKSFPRADFAGEIDTLDAAAKALGTELLSKAMALPSAAYKLLYRTSPATVLWTVHSSKSTALQARFKSFYNDWPQAQQKVPILLLAEMRITPELPGYAELQETLFYALMDGRLSTPEEMRAFLEPYSPPAPPPPISLRRPRAPRKETKAAKSRKKAPEPGSEETAPLTGETPVVQTAEPSGTDAPIAKKEASAKTKAAPPAPVKPAPEQKEPAPSAKASASSKKPVAASTAAKKTSGKSTKRVGSVGPAKAPGKGKQAPAPRMPRPSRPSAAKKATPAKAGGAKRASGKSAGVPTKKAAAAPVPARKGTVKPSPAKKTAAKAAPAQKKKAPAVKKAPVKKAPTKRR